MPDLDASVIDPEAIQMLRELASDDRDFLPQMIDLYLKGAHQKLPALEEHLRNGRGKEIAALSHELKSSSGNVGALGLHKLFEQLEADAGKLKLEALAPTLARVRALFPLVEAELTRISSEYRRAG